MSSAAATNANPAAGENGFVRREFAANRVKPRKTHFEFPVDEIPRLYVGDGGHVNTHILNGLNLFLPPFEEMLCRVFKSHLAHVRDPHLADQVRGFVGQEASHGRAHAKFCETLRAQGYDIDAYMGLLDWLFKRVLEQTLGEKIALSTAAGFEHYADLLVILLLDTRFLENCDPRVKEFFTWHAAEEAEHHTVAHDLLQQIDDSYLLRQLGSVLGLFVILGSLMGGAALMLAQDRKIFSWRTFTDLGNLFFGEYRLAAHIGGMFVDYLRPDYYPADEEAVRLAQSVLSPA